MAPSAVFWVDTLISSITGLIALALLLLVLGLDPRRRLNQTFSLFAAFVALFSLGSAVANLTLWLDSRVPAGSIGFGGSLFWAELVTTSFYFVGPALFAFSIAYEQTLASSVEPPNNRLDKAVVIIGFLAGLGLLPTFFNHQIVSQFYLDQVDLPQWEFTNLGHAASVIPLLFQALASILFWQNRQRLGGSALAISAAILLMGGIVGGLVRLPFHVINSSFAVGIIVTGYAVTSRQIFNPLQILTEQLKATVAEHTRELQRARGELQRLNEQHRRVAEISREIARCATPAEMVARLAELIHNRLGYHHVYLYRPDETNQFLVIRAAAGTAARTALEKGHQLRIGGRSPAGQAAAQHRPYITKARGDEANDLSDAVLPGARAEMALPLLVGSRLLGVLDLQSIHFDDFSDEDLGVMMSLADQFAVTLDNARLLQQTEAALAEVEKAQRQYLRQVWQPALHGPENAPAFTYTADDGCSATTLNAVRSPEIVQAATEGQPLVWKGDESQEANTLALPIALRGQVIGALQLQHKRGRAWQLDDIQTLSNMTERLALALENARLLEETQHRAVREQLAREITDQMRETMDLSTILRTTIQRLGQAIGAQEVAVRIMPMDPHAQPGEPGRKRQDFTPSG